MVVDIANGIRNRTTNDNFLSPKVMVIVMTKDPRILALIDRVEEELEGELGVGVALANVPDTKALNDPVP